MSLLASPLTGTPRISSRSGRLSGETASVSTPGWWPGLRGVGVGGWTLITGMSNCRPSVLGWSLTESLFWTSSVEFSVTGSTGVSSPVAPSSGVVSALSCESVCSDGSFPSVQTAAVPFLRMPPGTERSLSVGLTVRGLAGRKHHYFTPDGSTEGYLNHDSILGQLCAKFYTFSLF